VYDKNNAGYITNKFKVMKIIDEFCNEYSCADIIISTIQNNIRHKNIKLHETLLCSSDITGFFIKCYLTKKRALFRYIKNTTSILTYYPDGRIKEKIMCNDKNVCRYNYSFEDAIILLKNNYIYSGEYQKWNEEGELVIHKFYENGNIIKNLLNDYENTELLVNSFLINKEEDRGDEKKFMDTIKMLLSKCSIQETSLNEIKYSELVFRFLNSQFSLDIIKNKKKFAKFRMTLLDKIKEIQNEETIKKTLESKNNKKRESAKKLFSIMVELNDKIVAMNN